MRTLKTLCTVLLVCLSLSAYAQDDTEKNTNQFQVLTSSERDNLQMWFYERVNEMNLSEAEREQYYSVILYYAVKMERLNDTEKEYTMEEIKTKLNEYVNQTNAEVAEFLTEEQNKMHLENYGKIIRGVTNRLNQADDASTKKGKN